MPPTLLIVDDEVATRNGLRAALEESFEVFLAGSAEEAKKILQTAEIDVVLTDLRLGGDSGMDVLEYCKKSAGAPVVLMMTAYGSVATAVEAMRRGAWHFVTKPLNLDEVELLLKRALRAKSLESENRNLTDQIVKNSKLSKLIGKTPVMERISDVIRQVAPTRANVLIEGESGTGKEIVANQIHALSGRPIAKIVTVHCAALSPQLLESELFGHEKGAFTGAAQRRVGRFEQADGGTIFLDEIGEIDQTTQIKLLRVIAERTLERVGSNTPIKVDVRIIAATNKNLERLVAEQKFREDLYFRLNVVKITMPPLRERRDDIVLLANSFLQEIAKENGREVKPLSDAALSLLTSYSWPGNVRELRAAIEHGIVMSNDPVIDVRHLPLSLTQKQVISPQISESSKNRLVTSADLNLHINELQTIQSAVDQAHGNISQAARLLGISRRTLYRKLKEHTPQHTEENA